MWQRFTERARRVVFFAQEEAGRRGENFVEPEHLLLGMIRESDSVSARLLDRMDVRHSAIRAVLEQQMTSGSGGSGQDMQLTPRAKRVIDLAYDEARQLNNNYIGTEHLLLGMIRPGEGLAAETLIGLGADLERTRREVMSLQAENPGRNEDKAKAGIAGGSQTENLRVGDLGTLKSVSDRSAVEVSVEPGTFVALSEVFRARDGYGYKEMYEAGRFCVVPVQTKIKHLQALPEEQRDAGRGGLLIRVLEGEFLGRKGWISADEFERTGPDDAPFPPES